MKFALSRVELTHEVVLYLMGDEVYCAKKGTAIASELHQFVTKGGEIYVRKEDLIARGLREVLLEQTHAPDDFFSQLVQDIMENSDRIITF